MKSLLTLVLAAFTFALIASTAIAGDVFVKGYTKRDGTYVQPHYRSSPNSTKLDNFSTRGNVNPYTGQAGTKDPDSSYQGGYRREKPGYENSQGSGYSNKPNVFDNKRRY